MRRITLQELVAYPLIVAIIILLAAIVIAAIAIYYVVLWTMELYEEIEDAIANLRTRHHPQ